MTIEEAIEELGTLYVPRDGEQDRLADAQEMAIRSLKAWEKVKAEIEQKQYDFMADKDYDEGIRFGLMLAYQIIDKYLQEVSA